MGCIRSLGSRLCRHYRASSLSALFSARSSTSSSPPLPPFSSTLCAGNVISAHYSSSLSTRGLFLTRDISRSLSQLSLPSDGSDRLLLLDTLALVKKLEAQGFDAKQAEAITTAMNDVLNDCMQNVSDSFVSKDQLDQCNMTLNSACTKLQADIQSAQEKRLAAIQRETEKLKVDIGKFQNEIRFEMDKVSAGQRLDLNLERGRIKEELKNQSAQTSNLTNKLDNEIDALKMQLEGSKYDVIKYCIGTIISVYALGLALLRIFK